MCTRKSLNKHLVYYASIRSGGIELTKLIHTRLEDNNLIRTRGDRLLHTAAAAVVREMCERGDALLYRVRTRLVQARNKHYTGYVHNKQICYYYYS